MVSAYAVLDDPDQWAAFSVPDPDSQDADKTQGVWHSQVVVEGMHCGSCALNVEKALCAVPGVTQVTVNGATHRAEVVWRADKVKPSQWLQHVFTPLYAQGSLTGLCRIGRDRRSFYEFTGMAGQGNCGFSSAVEHAACDSGVVGFVVGMAC